jgi:hypothetical protein
MHLNAALLEDLLRERLSHKCALLAFCCAASPSVDAGKALRTGIKVLERAAYTADVLYGFLDGVECPSPEVGACSAPKTAAVFASLVIKGIYDLVRQRRRFDDRLCVLH